MHQVLSFYLALSPPPKYTLTLHQVDQLSLLSADNSRELVILFHITDESAGGLRVKVHCWGVREGLGWEVGGGVKV